MLLVTLLPLLGIAQTNTIGICGGVSVFYSDKPTRKLDFHELKRSPRIGLVSGFNLERLTTKKFLIGIGLLYQQRGYVEDYGGWTEYDSEYVYKNMRHVHMDYLAIPLKFGYQITNQKFIGNIYLGLMPSILIHSSQVVPLTDDYTGVIKGIVSINTYKENNSFDISSFLGFGFGYKIDKSLNILINGTGQIGVINSLYNYPFYLNRLKGVNVMIGLQYNINKR